MRLPVNDADLVVSIRPHVGPKALIYFGGNAEDVSLRLPAFSNAFPEYAIYLLHYRGYGGSSGTPSEALLEEDAKALFDKVHSEHTSTVLVGSSLGSGVAVHLASQRPASRLILVMPYNSIQEIAADWYPLIPISWILLDKFESWRYAPLIHVPTLIIEAEHDEVVPKMSSRQLYAHFVKGIATLKIIPRTNHDTISASPQFITTLRSGL
jgi:pimeloyl-ACP methyl ester carboxylesterase